MLNEITNYLEIDPKLGTAGQPSPDELSDIKKAGYELVINLVPPSSSGFLHDEQDMVSELGMDYIHIPVIWAEPTRQNLDDFFAAMNQNRQRKVLVHCQMNMRVSAFVFLYRVLVEWVSPETAQLEMQKIWEPNPTWQQFIEDRLAEK